MATVGNRKLTAEEFAALPEPPDGSKQELVRGEVVTMPPPGLEHGECQLNLGTLLKLYLREHPIGRVFTESGVITERGEDTVRGPDVVYWSKERLPLGLRVRGYHDQPPDLCVEVLSPSNTQRQIQEKVKEYLFAGVRTVWVVDPESRRVEVYRGPDEGRILNEGATLDGEDVLPGFRCRVAELFA